jgi:hypothetical protein
MEIGFDDPINKTWSYYWLILLFELQFKLKKIVVVSLLLAKCSN